jgi:hypothetical protein
MIAAMLAACSKSGNEDVAGPDRLIDEAVTLTVDLNTGSVTQAGYEWVDNSGVIHLQGRVIEGATVSGDLVGKFKTTITNSERNPQTGAGRETLIVECAMNWPSENRQGLFTGGMTQEFKTGARAPASLNAQGKEGFASLNLEVTFEEEAGNVKILVGKGRIVER